MNFHEEFFFGWRSVPRRKIRTRTEIRQFFCLFSEHRISAHSKYRTISSITKDVQKVYYNLRTKGEFVQELYYNREFQIMYSSSTLLFILL